MNARILLEERPPRRAANLTQEGECDEHAEKESSRDVGGAAVIGRHRFGLSIGRFCEGAAGCQLAFRYSPRRGRGLGIPRNYRDRAKARGPGAEPPGARQHAPNGPPSPPPTIPPASLSAH